MEWYKKQLETMTLSQLWEEWDIVTAPLKEHFKNKANEVKVEKIEKAERTQASGKVFS